jgi:cell division protein YceG involved in septum cleavage
MKKTIIKSSIAFIVIFALFFIASNKSNVHALNCYTVSLSNFKEVSKNIYVQPNTSNKDINNILQENISK